MKLKKGLALVLCLALLCVTFAACSGGAAASSAPAASAPASAPASTGDDTGTDAPSGALRMALVMDGSINDGGWYADCYAGGEAAKAEYGYEVAVSENLQQADFVTAIREYAAEGYDLIILSGNNFEDAVEQVYEEFPDTHFAGINFYLSADNVTAMGYDNTQKGFLGGAFAGLCTKTNVVGFIGGTDMTPTLDGASGFEQGAKYVNPDVEVVTAMCGSWNDAAKGKELAISQATTANVDVILGWAGSSDTGIIEGCKESGIHAIAQPLDILDSAPDALLGSMLASNEALVMNIAGKVAQGGATGMVDIADASLMGFGRFGDAVPDGIPEQLEEIRADLIAGKIELS